MSQVVLDERSALAAEACPLGGRGIGPPSQGMREKKVRPDRVKLWRAVA